MPASLTYNVCLGLSLLEWESIRQLLERPVRDKNHFKYSDTLFPVFAFLTGFQPLSPRQSLFTIGLGVARNVLVKKPISSLSSLQSIGLAALLLHAIKASQPVPLLGVGCLYLALRYIAAASGRANSNHSNSSRANSNPPNSSPPNSSYSNVALEQSTSRKKHDIQESMGVATTATTMWVGHCVRNGYFSSNDLFITGVSLVSFGHLSSYAFPKLFSSTAAQWNPISTLIANGISLLNYTAISLSCRLLLHYDIGTSILRALGSVGSHSIELYLLTSALDVWGLPRFVRRRIPGLKGNIITVFITNAIVLSAALVLDHFKITDRLQLPQALTYS